MELSATEIYVLLKELAPVLEGSRFVNFYELEDKSYVIKLKTLKGIGELRIIPSKLIYFLLGTHEKAASPSSFSLAVRRKLRSFVLSKIYQVQKERIIEILFIKNELSYKLMVELIPGGTIALLDVNDNIVACPKKFFRNGNLFAVGQMYPKPKYRLSITTKDDIDHLYNLLNKENERIVKVLASKAGLGGKYAEEVMYLANMIDKSKRLKELSTQEKYKLVEALTKLIDKLSNPSPCIAENNEGKCLALPFKLENLEKNGFNFKYVETFNDAIRIAYQRELEVKAEKIAEEELERKIKDIDEQIKIKQEKLQSLKIRHKMLYEVANLIMQNISLIETERIKIYEDLKSIDHNYEKNISENVIIKGINKRDKTLNLKLRDTTIQLPLTKKVSEHASSLFHEAKGIKEGIDSLSKEIERLKEEKSLLSTKPLDLTKRAIPKVKLREKDKWFKNYRWTFSSDGRLIVAGKDSKSNLTLFKRYLEPLDLVFHADIHGSPLTLLKEGKGCSDKVLNEAAEFTASYCKAWKEGFSSISVYYVTPDQVSISPPSGKYIPKGAFIIKGKRNYIVAKLRICFGCDLEGNLIHGPYGSVKSKADKLVIVVPGKKRAEELATMIAKELYGDHASDETVEQIKSKIPYGTGEIGGIEKVKDG